MFGRKARLYYCIRCKWNFLVCERQVVVLDEHGQPLAGTKGAERFDTLEEGPCPGLEMLQPHPPVTVYIVRLKSRRMHDERTSLVAANVPARSLGPGPVLRLLTRVRKDIGASP
jgi:hypothetical protein